MISIKTDISLVQESDLKAIYDTMPALRQERVDKQKFSADRARSIVAWSMLSDLLNENNVYINDYEYAVLDNGKPYLKSCPFHFSISHTDDAVAVAIANCEIGVDIQRVEENYQSAMKKVFTNAEIKSVKNANDFTKIWTLKEAIVKCTGAGISKMKSYDFTTKIDGFDYDSYNYNEKYVVSICKKSCE